MPCLYSMPAQAMSLGSPRDQEHLRSPGGVGARDELVDARAQGFGQSLLPSPQQVPMVAIPAQVELLEDEAYGALC
jgi:hypothetical protein